MSKLIKVKAEDLKMSKEAFNKLSDDDRYKIAFEYLKKNKIVDVSEFKGVVQIV